MGFITRCTGKAIDSYSCWRCRADTTNPGRQVMLLQKYRYQTNLTACAIEFMKMVGVDKSDCQLTHWLNRRLYSALTRCVCTINTFIHKTYENGRGRLTYPPETRCVCTNKIVHHRIHANQNQVTQAVGFVQNSTLGRIDKSASTVHEIVF